MQEEKFTDLLDQAIQMLRDRPKPEAELIYAIYKLDEDLRAAIVMGYDLIKDDPWPNHCQKFEIPKEHIFCGCPECGECSCALCKEDWE